MTVPPIQDPRCQAWRAPPKQTIFTAGGVAAALNITVLRLGHRPERDKRITNRHVWEDDLEALPNATLARNVVLADDVVGKLVTTAYAHDRKLGLLCDVVSTTGARPSQAVRLLVADQKAPCALDRPAPQQVGDHPRCRLAPVAD